MKSFWMFLVGGLLMLAGIAWAVHEIGLATQWIVIISLVVFGAIILRGASLARSGKSTE